MNEKNVLELLDKVVTEKTFIGLLLLLRDLCIKNATEQESDIQANRIWRFYAENTDKLVSTLLRL